MNKITEAAKNHALSKNIVGTFIDPRIYDAFIEGALSPETEDYYKRKYVPNICDNDLPDADFDPFKEARRQTLELILSGNLLQAVKYWKDCNPGMGLKEAKEYIDTLRPSKAL